MKQLLLTLLLFVACFGGAEARAMPTTAVTGSGVQQQEEGIAQGELYTWPGALPELERVLKGQTTPTTPFKNQGSSGLGVSGWELEHWLQQGIARQIATGQLCQASLTGIRIIFPFHSFW